jgi:deoxyribodipyrimidine photolyase-related protein
MSDETKGPWCKVWDGLSWSSIAEYGEFFLSNPRLLMMAWTWQKFAPERNLAILRPLLIFYQVWMEMIDVNVTVH